MTTQEPTPQANGSGPQNGDAPALTPAQRRVIRRRLWKALADDDYKDEWRQIEALLDDLDPTPLPWEKANGQAVVVRTKKKADTDEPLETVAKKILAHYQRALRAWQLGKGDYAENQELAAALHLQECKERVEAGEYDGSWEEFCTIHFPGIEPDIIAQLLDTVAPLPRGDVVAAADRCLAWFEKHVVASPHNHVVGVVWGLASYYHKVVPTFPKLVYWADDHSSGKSTAAHATAEVANFSEQARRARRVTPPVARRRAHITKQGVRLEDIHRYGQKAEIYDIIVASFESDATYEISLSEDQDKVKVYDIGGCPIIVTTNRKDWFTPEVARRCFMLPMIQATPPRKGTNQQRRLALARVRKIFEDSPGSEWDEAGDDGTSTATAKGIERVEAAVLEPMPEWMDPSQRDKYQALFAVTRALLNDEWVKKLEAAARHIENVTKTVGVKEHLVKDLWEISQAHPESIGATPTALCVELRRVNSEQWGNSEYWTSTKIGSELHKIHDGDGRELTRHSVRAHDRVLTYVDDVKKGDDKLAVREGPTKPGAKFYPWKHFGAVWKRHEVEEAKLRQA